jgi:hypothetical protein
MRADCSTTRNAPGGWICFLAHFLIILSAWTIVIKYIFPISYAAFGSIRMEPVFMILGQSAGTAAALAIGGHQSVQEVPYEKLKELLVKQGQKL